MGIFCPLAIPKPAWVVKVFVPSPIVKLVVEVAKKGPTVKFGSGGKLPVYPAYQASLTKVM